MFPKKELAQLVISACNQFEIDTVVISPGSRNAPLTIGFSNHPNIETLSVVDERCAAFFAMGIAQQKQKPVAIVCSSGSALLNYYPAIAEAFYSNIPLVVISADRPKHLIDIGDGQTIRQENVFENHILFSANLIDEQSQLEKNEGLLINALEKAVLQKGPVHINVPFDEPLYETVASLKSFNFSGIASSEAIEQENDYHELITTWKTSTKKMILVGSNFPDVELQDILNKLVEDDSVLVLTETTSNLYNSKFVNSIDKLIFPLVETEFLDLQPEVLITLGGMVISKKIKQFLRKYQPTKHWHIDTLKAMDTYHCLSEHVKEKPIFFLKKLVNENISESLNKETVYQNKWLNKNKDREVRHKKYLANTAYSDLKVFETVLNSIPEKSQIQISNSSTIRYSQLFNLNSSLQVFCNRGTSGIDGSTSTAIGAAYAHEGSTTFITGDLSFFYDSNALWNTNVPKDFRIIILNNAGGGIFRFIPGPLSTNATQYFETPHNLTAEYLAKMYNFEYVSVKDLESLNSSLPTFYKESDQPKIMEIFTPKEKNDVVLKNYFKNL